MNRIQGLVMRGLAALALTLPIACGSKKSDVMVNGPGTGTEQFGGRRVINLFGLRDAERHLIEVGTHRGQLFLLAQDRETGEYDWVDCPLETAYEYTQHPMRTHEMEIRSTAELAAELPLSQSQFQGALERGNWFRFHWAAVGSYTPDKFQLPRSNAECKRATHFVQILTVGAVSWSEMSESSAEAGVDAKVAKLGGKVSSGEKTSDVLGNIEQCFHEGEAGPDCRIPLQVSVAALRDHHFCPDGNVACETRTAMATSTCLEPGPNCLPRPDGKKDVPSETEVVPIYRGEAPASRYISQSIEQVLLMRSRPATAGYGFSTKGALLLSGLVKSGGVLEAPLEMEAGAEYALLAAGDSDAEDLDLAVVGVEGARDTSVGKEAVVRFTAPSSTTANIILKGAHIKAKEGSFVALLILKKGGHDIPLPTIRASIGKALERGELVSSEQHAPHFHEKQWAFYVIPMTGGVYKMSGLELPAGDTYAFAVGDEHATDLDIGLVSGEELKEIDSESDAMPIVRARRSSPILADLLLASEGKALTVVSSGILERLEGVASPAEACDQSEYPDISVGTRVILGRHTVIAGDENWADEMAEYVGRAAKITERVGTDKSGCQVARVDIDGGTYAWRLRDAKVDSSGLGTGTRVAVGRWTLTKVEDRIVIFRSDGRIAAEFVDGSNGWWNWFSGGKAYTVWSVGTKDEDASGFKVKPWQTPSGKAEAPTQSEFTSGNSRVVIVGDSIMVVTADNGQVTFKNDGSVSFKTFRGEVVKM